MASKLADELSWAIYDLIEEMTADSIYKTPSQARMSVANKIDDLLKNLLVATVDHYTVK